jgi:inhibitor of KinA sporulation pathway (predicted exonuclease)
MNYAIIDLEFTSWKGSWARNWSLPWEKKEIIQIGAIKFNNFQKFSDKNINIYIKPKINKHLSSYIQKLTGIRQYHINELGISLSEADILLRKFFSGVKKIYCNGLDKEILINNYKLLKMHEPRFIKNIYNINPIFVSILNIDKEKLISSELHRFFKIKDNNRQKHNGLNDCINIFNCLKKINNVEKILEKKLNK